MLSSTAARGFSAAILLLACLSPRSVGPRAAQDVTAVDTLAIEALARELASDAMRGRGPYTRENEAAARLLAGRLRELGAVPVLDSDLLVPFAADSSHGVVYNVVGMLPARSGSVSGEVVGITAHFDHLGVGRADSTGDTIYNGFLDAAVPVAMVMDVARRYAAQRGERALLVMFLNLEEQGLQGARALVARPDFAPLLPRISLLIGMDAGSPAGEALEYQLMGTVPSHAGAVLADSLARARGWSTTATPPRAISDVFVFSQRDVPIIFPIPGRIWKGYSTEQRDQAMARFDHYHQPSDEWHPEFPWTGTAAFADWIWTVVREASTGR